MFKEIQRTMSKFLTGERLVILVVLILLAWGIYTYAGSKSFSFDGLATGSPNSPPSQAAAAGSVMPFPQSKPPGASSGYAPQPVASPADLLPNDQNSAWAALNPGSMNGGSIVMPDLLTAGYHIGLDTIGQTLRNANLQERSDPVIPKSQVGPWNQSTIEPDLGRVPLEVGYGCR